MIELRGAPRAVPPAAQGGAPGHRRPSRGAAFADMSVVVWLGIALCLSQSAIFSGLNLAVFSLSRLRLEPPGWRRNCAATRSCRGRWRGSRGARRLVWSERQRRIFTGSDPLGRLLRGIARPVAGAHPDATVPSESGRAGPECSVPAPRPLTRGIADGAIESSREPRPTSSTACSGWPAISPHTESERPEASAARAMRPEKGFVRAVTSGGSKVLRRPNLSAPGAPWRRQRATAERK